MSTEGTEWNVELIRIVRPPRGIEAAVSFNALYRHIPPAACVSSYTESGLGESKVLYQLLASGDVPQRPLLCLLSRNEQRGDRFWS